MMVCHSRRTFHYHSLLVLLFFLVNGYCGSAANSLPTSKTQNAFQLYFPESGWVVSDLDGDHMPDFAGGQRLGRTKDGYFYRVQLELSGDAHSSWFTVFHNNALGLKIAAIDVDGDNDTDLIISDRFFRQHVGIWLNDGRGRFVNSLPGRFSPNSGLDLALIAVGLNWVRQSTVDKQQRRLPDDLPATGYIQPLLLRDSALSQHHAEWLFHLITDLLHQRAPPTALTA